MERCFQYYVPFTIHTQYRARAREHNNMMQKLKLNYMRLHEHTYLIHVTEHYGYVRTHIYIEDMRMKKVNEYAVTCEQSVFKLKP